MSIEKFKKYLEAYDGWGEYGPDFTLTRKGAQFILLALDELAGQVGELTDRLDREEPGLIGKLVTQANDDSIPVGSEGWSEEGDRFRKVFDDEIDEETWERRNKVALRWEPSDVYAAEMDRVRIDSIPPDAYTVPSTKKSHRVKR